MKAEKTTPILFASKGSLSSPNQSRSLETEHRQSPIGAETSDDENVILEKSNVIEDFDLEDIQDWEPWEHDEAEEVAADEEEPRQPSPVIEKSQIPSNAAKIEASTDDFFADMEPVISNQDNTTIIEVATTAAAGKFAVLDGGDGGWSDVDDEAWS